MREQWRQIRLKYDLWRPMLQGLIRAAALSAASEGAMLLIQHLPDAIHGHLLPIIVFALRAIEGLFDQLRSQQ